MNRIAKSAVSGVIAIYAMFSIAAPSYIQAETKAPVNIGAAVQAIDQFHLSSYFSASSVRAVLPIASVYAEPTAQLAEAAIKTSPLSSDKVKTVFMRITAYASTPDETDDTPFITASGEHVRDGIVASNALPFGTKIEIPSLFGNKVFTVEDRMAKRFSNTIDIWMPNKGDAIVFGMSHANVIILPASAPDNYAESAANEAISLR